MRLPSGGRYQSGSNHSHVTDGMAPSARRSLSDLHSTPDVRPAARRRAAFLRRPGSVFFASGGQDLNPPLGRYASQSTETRLALDDFGGQRYSHSLIAVAAAVGWHATWWGSSRSIGGRLG